MKPITQIVRGVGPVLLLSLAVACTGSIGARDSDGSGNGSGNQGGSDNGQGGSGNNGTGGSTIVTPPADACMDRALPVEPLRRLSQTQYHNTIADLFGDTLAQPFLSNSQFPVTLYTSGFEADAESNNINTQSSNAIEDNAERIAGLILADADPYLQDLMPCSLSGSIADSDIDDCIDDFINDFGLKAYRRPITDGERTLIRTLYDDVRETDDARDAFAAVVQLFIQSPALLYRVERGTGSADGDGSLRLSDYEMATRLSYFFTQSMPDDELFAEAAAGRLSTAQQVADQAMRLMDGDRFAEVMGAFHSDWLHLGKVPTMVKDTDVFPSFNSQLQDSMAAETEAFMRYVLDEADGSVQTLLGSDRRPVNDVMATHYGVDGQGATRDTWELVNTPERRGLLTQASFMAALAEDNRTSPIHRGAFFREEILCFDLPPLPDNVDTQTALESTSDLPTARERLSPLMVDGNCSGCHTAINPLGLALENYDGVGLWRDQENGADIISSGELTIDDGSEPFETPVQMAGIIAASDDARDCYGLHWYRAAMGRGEFAEDQCSIATVQKALADSGGDIRRLLLAVTQTDAFLLRRQVQP